MNPVAAAVLLAFAIASYWAPWRRPGWKDAGTGLLFEAAVLATVVLLASLAGHLATPTGPGRRWGLIALYMSGYWYACPGGIGIVRMVLELAPLGQQPTVSSISRTELERGRIIGVLERAVALTLILLGQYGALGLIIAAKALARFKALDDRDFAEYFLIGTLASVLHALVVGVGLRLLVS